ncbi:MAG: chemotaxis protein methyltransferase [Geobacteraceae bacterium]|nr:MAG: chemotaxis protein methyltransferase [Geobacteraceae bacterium]
MSLRILIISADKAFCDSLSGLLAADGHTVSCILGTIEELKTVRAFMPELIVLEVSSTGIGSIEVMPRLQRTREARHVPVIVISAYPELEYEFLNVFDFIPKPVNMARLREGIEILAKGEDTRVAPAKAMPLRNSDYRLFYEYLVAHSGLHFERRNMKILERGIASRMGALRIGSHREYFDHLTRYQESRQELQKLLQHLTVGETYFFRYRAHFEALKTLIATELTARNGKSLRFWSAGCSTGEEPYSMAMTIMETVPDWRKRDIRILATDINNRALKKAREGVYRSWAMRVTEKRYLDRYFDWVGDKFRVKEEVKSLIEFSPLNLQTAGFPTEDGDSRKFDAIFCRNVMIYFTLDTTRRIVERFAECLVPGGYLFLGHAEALSQISSQFERHTRDGSFYYSKKSGAHAFPLRREQRPAKEKKSAKGGAKPAPVKLLPQTEAIYEKKSEPELKECYERARALFDEENFPEAAKLLAEVIRRKPDHVAALVTQGFILANDGLFEDALAICSKALTIDDLLPEAYFLKGLVLDMINEPAAAAEEYRKAILLNMDFVMPHYHLGRLFVRLGKEKEGLRELRNSLRILERGEEDGVVPHSGGLSRVVFLEHLRSELVRAV